MLCMRKKNKIKLTRPTQKMISFPTDTLYLSVSLHFVMFENIIKRSQPLENFGSPSIP